MGKIDSLLGSNILCEIKSCTYEDYRKIIRTQQPREKDLLQAMTYQYILTNYLEEIQSEKVTLPYGGDKPKLEKYDIKQIQFIYVAHDVVASDAESYAEIVELMRSTKKLLQSKNNQFFFITSLLVDIDDELRDHCNDFVKKKIADILKYMKAKNSPTKKSRFVNFNNCYFCPYREICEITEKK